LPLLALEAVGYQCTLFSDAGASHLDGLDVLVVVKSFTPGDFFLIQEAGRRGIPVVLDLCDNIFVDTYGGRPKAPPAEMFMAMAQLVQAVVVTTEPLAAVVRARVSQDLPIYVVPDGIEASGVVSQGVERLARAAALQRGSGARRLRGALGSLLRRVRQLHSAALLPLLLLIARRVVSNVRKWYRASSVGKRVDSLRAAMRWGLRHASATGVRSLLWHDQNVKRILWFGNHGAPHARFGMLDLLDIKEALERIATEFEVELVVVSNNVQKYQEHIRPLAIRSRYIEWSSDRVIEQLNQAAVVLVPNSRDLFSICKSANRAVLALAHGVPVVATSTPALEPLAGCVVLDDFLGGLRLYLSDDLRARQDVHRAQELIPRLFGQGVIAGAWQPVLATARATPMRRVESSAQLVVALHLIQDLDLALPIVEAAKARNISVLAVCSTSLLAKSPRVLAALRAGDIEISPLLDDQDIIHGFAFPPSARALLTAAETNLGPHRFTRLLTECARHAGLFTATLQHGFENVGLTYDDEIHRVDKIDFAADCIYLWGPLATLHSRVPPATRSKCLSVGCPKPARPEAVDLAKLLGRAGRVIGVFENLHWHRYSDAYRQFFLDGVLAVAHSFPDTIFLVKPHHAGRWLTLRQAGPSAANLIIADPTSPVWEAHTAATLMGQMSAVVTTPSTVALDAARQGLPVAVVAHDLDLANYAPLRPIVEHTDWIDFVDALDTSDSYRAYVAASAEYVARVLIPGDAAGRIADDLVSRGCGEPARAGALAGQALTLHDRPPNGEPRQLSNDSIK
jgi:glycosyltransferase involved in cell wall biosynthesis